MYFYDPDKLRAELDGTIATVGATASADPLFDAHPELKTLHLTEMRNIIFKATGGVIGGMAPLTEPTDTDVILFFDIAHRFAEGKNHDEEDMAEIADYTYTTPSFGDSSPAQNSIASIKNLINGDRNSLRNLLGKESIAISDADMAVYSDYVASSSQNFVKGAMAWLVERSGVGSEGYLRNIADVEAMDGADVPLLNRIYLESAFKVAKDRTATVEVREMAATSGVRMGTKGVNPRVTGFTQLDENALGKNATSRAA